MYDLKPSGRDTRHVYSENQLFSELRAIKLTELEKESVRGELINYMNKTSDSINQVAQGTAAVALNLLRTEPMKVAAFTLAIAAVAFLILYYQLLGAASNSALFF